MHVESVTWISERKDLLYSFFFFSGLITYIYYQKSKINPDKPGQKSKFYIITLFLFILSLLSKPAAICFPLVLLLIDYYLNRHEKRDIRHETYLKSQMSNLKSHLNKLPFFLLSIIFGIIAINSQKAGGTMSHITPLYSFFNRIFLISYSAVFYIIKLFVPNNLCAMHPYPVKSSGMLPVEYYLSALFIIGIAVSLFLIKSAQLKKDMIFGLLFYLATIILVLQIIPIGDSITAETL